MNNPTRLNPECIRCLIKGRIDHCPEGATKEEQIDYMQKILSLIANAPKHYSAPVVTRDVNHLVKEMFGVEDDYKETKRYFNSLMLSKEGRMMQEIAVSEDELKLALRFAMMGNYIDFGALESVDEDKLEEFLVSAKDIEIRESEYDSLRDDILKAQKIVYLTDNCGEIVTDKMLIQVMKRMNPTGQITVIVRGTDVINDATMEDAKQVGLTDLVTVVGNGSDIAGTWLDDLSVEARNLVETADMIIAKGQGNFETMYFCGFNVYYVFMCKCEMFAERFQVPRFSGMLVNDRNL